MFATGSSGGFSLGWTLNGTPRLIKETNVSLSADEESELKQKDGIKQSLQWKKQNPMGNNDDAGGDDGKSRITQPS